MSLIISSTAKVKILRNRIKYNANEYVLNKQYALEILERNNIFAKAIGTKKQIFTCFMTNQKLRTNVWSEEMVDVNIVLCDLFS